MALVLTSPHGSPGQLNYLLSTNGPAVEAEAVETNLSSCIAPAGFTTAAVNAALATGAAEVCLPPGIYDITGLVEVGSSQVLNFQPGAQFRMAASGLGVLNVLDGGAIWGKPVIRFDTTSAVAYTAVKLQTAAYSEPIEFQVNVDVGNCKLLRIAGDWSRCAGVTLRGVGSFFGAVEYMHDDGSPTFFAEHGPVYWRMIDDGITTRNYAWVVRFVATRCKLTGGVYVAHGGRQLINAIIDYDVGQHCLIENPQFNSSAGALFGILVRDVSEFLTIVGGEMVGNYLAGSVGLQMGTPGGGNVPTPAVGNVKCYDLKIRNWEKGVRVTGSCDAGPQFFGGAITNCKLAHIEIDSERAGLRWPVSGIGLFGLYTEDVAFPSCIFMHLVSGDLLGGTIGGGCEIGYTNAAVVAEATMGINVLEIGGNRLPASAPTDAFTIPNTVSNFFFGRNATSGSNLISKGAFAARATSIDDMVCSTLRTASLTIGAATDPAITKRLASFATANFGAGIGAGAAVELTFAFPGVLTTDYLGPPVISGALAANTSLLFFAFVPAAGQVTLRAVNYTAVAVGAISGTFLFQAFRGF